LTAFLQKKGLEVELAFLVRVVPLIQERIGTLAEALEWIDFFFEDEVYPDPAELPGKKMDAAQTVEALAEARAVLAQVEPFDRDAIEAVLRAKADELGLKAGQFFQPIRIAVTGRRVAPPLFGTLELIGRQTVLERLDNAREALVAASAT
jgi:glutamyl-tRNA synthetase